MDRADAGRWQRREDGDRVDIALVEQAEHDIDGDNGGEDQPGLAGERFGKLRRIAGIDADDARGHADFRLERLHGIDGIPERFAGAEVEGQRHRGELRKVRDRERRSGARQGRDRRQRHLRAEHARQIEF